AELAVSPATQWGAEKPASRPGPRRDGVTSLGDQLRAARERRGVTLDDVSDTTRIRTSYLEALERHHWEALPADVFTRGYVRTYAEYLGLDHEHLLKVYARERRIAGVDGSATSEAEQQDAARAFLERLAQTKGVAVRRSRAWIKWLALGLGGTALAALAVWIVPRLLGPGRSAPTVRTAPPRAEQSPAVVPAPLPTPTATTLTPPPVEPQSLSHLKVQDSGVGTAVVNHRLVGRGDRFREGTVVWFWTSVAGGRSGDKIRHVWLHQGRSVAEVDLKLKSAQWRTQSRRPLPKGLTGNWTVEARDAEGHVMASTDFTCVAAD
ncbi:MAG TPA: DUF2914 domain-containing protein, partial [Candidatus Polarisedimenticolaceae bacterium]|nr:DUF2914 domain-containing protein [Candidatus Polarisedimenticolaceae bacterium]